MEEDREALTRALLADMLRVVNLTLPRIGARFESELGASLVELDLLAELARASDRRLRMCEISQRLTTSTTSVTRLVDGLERRGYATRVLSAGDRRVVYAVLTEKGAELLMRAHPVAGPALEEYFGCYFTTGEMERMRVLLARVIKEANDRSDAGADSDR